MFLPGGFFLMMNWAMTDREHTVKGERGHFFEHRYFLQKSIEIETEALIEAGFSVAEVLNR